MPLRIKFSQAALKSIVAKAKEMGGSPISAAVAREVGAAVTEEMLSLIAVGQSPIKGSGRFPAYKNPKKYPGKRKPARPVNLSLEGDFLADLSFRPVAGAYGYDTEIFYASELSQKKEQGHRVGVKGQPKRPTLPEKRGEEFAVRIQAIIKEIYKRRIKTLIDKA